ncbi:MAG: sulfatase-like hydrolase/transferase, partial [Planctomycetota bacterium]
PLDQAERFLSTDYAGHVREVYERSRAEVLTGGRSTNAIHRRMLTAGGELSEADVDALRALYLAEVAYADAELGRLLDALGPECLVAVTADHGEEFGEHGVFEHRQLYEETLHVPLIVRFPNGELAGRVLDERVTLIDLHRTVLTAAGIEPAREVAGVDLAGLARGEFRHSKPTVSLTTEHLDPLHGERLPWLRAIRSGEGTLIERLEPGGGTRALELYPADDRQQQAPLVDVSDAPAGQSVGNGRVDALAAAIRGELEAEAARRARLLSDPRLRMRKLGSAEAVQRLVDLGYLDDED